MLISSSAFFVLVPFQLVITGIYLELDPFPKIFKILVGNNLNFPIVYVLFALLRVYLCFLCTIGAVRVILITIIPVVIFICNLFTFIDDLLLNLAKKGFSKLEKFHSVYSELQIFLSMIEFCENLACIHMTYNVSTLILYNYLVIRGFSILPLYFYAFFPTATLITSYAAFYTITSISEISKMLYQVRSKIKIHSDFQRKSLYSKKSNSFPPLFISARVGPFKIFHYDRSTLLTFFWVVFEHLTNLLLATSQ